MIKHIFRLTNRTALIFFLLYVAGLKEISLTEAKKWKEKNINVIPGQKLCPTCKISINKSESETEEDSLNEEDVEMEHLKKSFQSQSTRSSLNATLDEFEQVP